MSIRDLFSFGEATFWWLSLRLLMLILGSAIVATLVMLLINALTKKKESPLGFGNHLAVCFLYGLAISFFGVGAETILMLRSNGLDSFDKLEWSWQCGWILVIPEIVTIAMIVIAFILVMRHIKKSIVY